MYAINCFKLPPDPLRGLVSEMTYYVSSGTLNPTYSLTPLRGLCLWISAPDLLGYNPQMKMHGAPNGQYAVQQ